MLSSRTKAEISRKTLYALEAHFAAAHGDCCGVPHAPIAEFASAIAEVTFPEK